MEARELVQLALQVDIFLTVFVFGPRATHEDVLYPLRRPGCSHADLASAFMSTARGIPYSMDQTAAYIGSWVKAPKYDKHAILPSCCRRIQGDSSSLMARA